MFAVAILGFQTCPTAFATNGCHFFMKGPSTHDSKRRFNVGPRIATLAQH